MHGKPAGFVCRQGGFETGPYTNLVAFFMTGGRFLILIRNTGSTAIRINRCAVGAGFKPACCRLPDHDALRVIWPLSAAATLARAAALSRAMSATLLVGSRAAPR